MRSYKHFEGKEVVEHLVDARQRGVLATKEPHGIEMPGYLSAAIDSTKQTSVALILLWVLFSNTALSTTTIISLLILFALGWSFWLTGRSATLGWARLGRLHALIEQERWEIEHHRAQERDELMQMYKAKGFQGKLLNEVVNVLMADDNRLLRIMLEEELGLSLEAYEHPLKQASGAFLGTLFPSILSITGALLFPEKGLPITATALFFLATLAGSIFEQNRRIPSLIWTVAIALCSVAVVYFTAQLLFPA